MGGDYFIGDVFKFYWYFFCFEKNGVIGIVFIVFFYIGIVFVLFVVLYLYFLCVYNNGCFMDVYYWLYVCEDEFFIFYDLEIFNVELSYVCKKVE